MLDKFQEQEDVLKQIKKMMSLNENIEVEYSKKEEYVKIYIDTNTKKISVYVPYSRLEDLVGQDLNSQDFLLLYDNVTNNFINYNRYNHIFVSTKV